MEYEVFLTPRAKRDLIAIHKFIARDNPDAATSFCQELTSQALSLRNYPDRHAALGKHSDARKWALGNYLIIYDVFPLIRRVEVLRFWHSARDQGRLRLREEPDLIYGGEAAISLEQR